LKRLADQVEEKYHAADLLVNNAGVTRPVPHDDLDGLDDDLIDQIFCINWRGAFAAIRTFKDLGTDGDSSTVVNISSVAAVTGLDSNVACCASKAVLDSVTRSLARALAPKIWVVSVSPDWVEGEHAKLPTYPAIA
jgi:3-oxoacyl-[acyl-carrier protein] reductase